MPLMIFGAVGIVTGLLTLLLPETTHMSSPELVYDAEMINRYVAILLFNRKYNLLQIKYILSETLFATIVIQMVRQ